MENQDTPILKGNEKRKKAMHPLTKNVTMKSKQRKNRNQGKTNKNGDNTDEEENDITVDFNGLSVHTLRKYRKQFNLQIPSNTHKTELVKEVSKHFPNMPIEAEKTIVTYFIHFVKHEDDSE